MDLGLTKEMTDVSLQLLIGVCLLLLIILLSKWQSMGMEQAYLVSFSRGFVQLMLMALFLTVLFELQNILLLLAVLFFMSLFAAYSSYQSHPEYPNVFLIQIFAICTGSIPVLLFCGITGVIELIGEYLIPMGGMVIANAMTITDIVLERMFADMKKMTGELEAALSLGASAQQATNPIMRTAFRAGVLPNTNRVAVLGIVSIPGLMSGMIIGGMEPQIAAIYQIVIFLMIITAGMVAEIIAGYLFIRQLFNNQIQIKHEVFGYNA